MLRSMANVLLTKSIWVLIGFENFKILREIKQTK